MPIFEIGFSVCKPRGSGRGHDIKMKNSKNVYQ
jgi:hypothetical protein